MTALPIPSAESQAHSQALCRLIQQKIADSSGWISFAQLMHMALYTPRLGYYSGGAQKFGDYSNKDYSIKGGGDFVTAPEISPLFAQTLARQAAQILAASQGDILELGAGTGKLAADLLLALAEINQLPKQYFILEVSDYLRQIQRETLQKKLPAELLQSVVWLNNLAPSPPLGNEWGEGWGEGSKGFTGLILANEVLDALPVHLVYKNKGELFERGLAFKTDFIWQDKPLNKGELFELASAQHLPDDYLSEFCPAAAGLVRSLAASLDAGAILLIDYGFGAAEYYHPQRSEGTLMCHYQHFAHSNPLINIGLQDITAHVNFSQIASACEPHGISLAGFCNQAQFLINCGMLEIMAQHSPDSPQFMKMAAAAQKLLSPAEMGELFKAIAFTKNLDTPLIGFSNGDKSHVL